MSKRSDKKVYCENCLYCKVIEAFNCAALSGNPFCQCHYPENVFEQDNTDWYSKKPPYKKYEEKPHEINANNDCTWYEETLLIDNE